MVTLDVIGLYTNITYKEGLESLKEQLDKRNNPKIPTEFLIKLMEIILYNNIFEFHETYWKQEIVAAMGSKPIPQYANNFMAKLDKIIKNLDKEKNILFLKRFLDDLFLLFRGTTRMLHALFVEINKISPTIKFTMNHTTNEHEDPDDRCDCPPTNAIPFLDTMCSI